MNQNEATAIVTERCNAMLQDERINKIYQSHKTKDEAQTWLIKTALATLIVPIEERKPQIKINL